MDTQKVSLIVPSAVVGVTALLVALVVTPLALRLGCRLGIVDVPEERKIHRQPIPYLGGLSFFFALVVSFGVVGVFYPSLWRWEYWGLLAGVLGICLLGCVDDICGLGAWTKLPIEILIILLACSFGLRFDRLSNPLGDHFVLGWLGLPVTVLWFLGLMNAINLSDGLDGLAAGISCIAAVTMFFIGFGVQDATVCLTSAVVFGMTLGFLRFNFHPAKIFMGDMGSLTLGFVLAAIGVMGDRKSSTALPLLVPLIALGVCILDTALAVVRRLYRGTHVFQADREHLHHRLMGLGLSHRQTVLLIYYFSAYLSISALILSGLATRQTVLVLIVLGMGLFLAMMALEFIERRSKAVATAEPPCLTVGSQTHETRNVGGRSACNKLLFPALRTRKPGDRYRPRRGRRTDTEKSRTRRR